MRQGATVDELTEYLEYKKQEQQYQMEESYWEFFKEAWKQIEPSTPLIENWHLKEIADILQEEVERVARREPSTGDIIINVPPGTSKSTLTTKLLNAWAWTQYPWMKFITSSYSGDLARDHAVKTRDLIRTEWYQERWGHVYKLKFDENRKSQFATDKGGVRIATSVGGTILGKHADIFMADDPLDVRRAASEVELEKPNNWWDKTTTSRLTNQAISVRIIIMQRLNELDLTGHCLSSEEKDTYRHICLPAKVSDKVRPRRLIGKYINGLLDPERFGEIVLARMKSKMGSLEYAGQMMQTPVPEEGNLIKPDKWFKKFTFESLTKLAFELDQEIVWDFEIDGAFTEDETNAPTAIMAYSRIGGDIFMRDIQNVWMELPEMVKFVPEFIQRNQGTKQSRIFIEPKASGLPAAQSLHRYTKLNIIIDKAPRYDKTARVKAALPYMEAGRYHTMNNAPWEEEYYTQLKTFPGSKLKDMVDVTTQAVNRDEIPGQEIFGMEEI